MNKELKDELTGIFMAEPNEAIGWRTADNIGNGMRLKYGGYWTAFAGNISNYISYNRPASGRLAVLDFDEKRWNVYEHDCSKNYEIPISKYSEFSEHRDFSYALPSLEFTWTGMDAKKQKQLIFAIFSAENEEKVGQAKIDHIGKEMETFYGGTWSVHSFVGDKYGYYWGDFQHFADFKYDNKRWIVYKNGC